jgi:hypothetical protein
MNIKLTMNVYINFEKPWRAIFSMQKEEKEKCV